MKIIKFTILVISMVFFTNSAWARSLSLTPDNVWAMAGDTAEYEGFVSGRCRRRFKQPSDLFAGGDLLGAVYTLDPTGSVDAGARNYAYGLMVDIPPAAAFGTYDVEVKAVFSAVRRRCRGAELKRSALLHIVAGFCPGGNGAGWFFQRALSEDDPFDKNQDGWICTQINNGQGEGNSANRKGAEEEGHVDGHNHKDNNNPE